ncbi:MAG: hypothetical protein NC390_01135 [Fusobacterium sp.]|nr:hypothetical protein [Fusobacterium sp.]
MAEINPIGLGAKQSHKTHTKAKTTNVNESLFLKLDKNKDGKISEQELRAAGYQGKDLAAMEEAIFFAERNTNKWFKFDKDKSGFVNNAEEQMWNIHNTDDNHTIGDMTPEEFAKKNNININDIAGEDFENWCAHWIETDDPMQGIKAIIKERYGKEFSDEETQLLYDAMKNQANRWLFKDDSLYTRLNISAYTRLATTDQTVSCCGGDISKPPIGEQPKLDANGELMEANSCSMIFSDLEDSGSSNSAAETKNRLAWAAFKTVSDKDTARMSPEEYAKYQADWNKVRDMKASDFRALLQPENRAELEKFEANANMTVKQIVDYIDIVESATGKNFDENDWALDSKTFHCDIMEKLNGTFGDEKVLEGKTRADVPPEKQALLKYLEEHNLLLEQFKE